MGQLSRTKTVINISLLVVIWGLCWPIYKIALAYTPPILFAGMRSLLGGILLGLLILSKWKLIRWRETWPIYCISALLNTLLFYGLQTVGLMYLPEGLFSVLVYLQPVLVGIFAWLWLGETMSALKIIGLLIGFAGVGVISMDSLAGHISLLGILLAIASAVSWAVGVIYVKKVSKKVDAMWLVSFQCILGGIALTCIGMGFERWSGITWNVPYLSGLLFGAIFGIPAAFVLYYNLVNTGEASQVATYTFLVPLIALFIGTLFLHEPFTVYLFVGLILIVVSIILVNSTSKSIKLGNRQTSFDINPSAR